LSLLFVLTGAVSFFAWPILSLLTAVADRSLGANEHGFGYGALLSAFGVGALLSALTAASCSSPTRRPQFLAGGVVLATAGLIGLAAIGFMGLTAAGALGAAMGCCAVLGGGLILFNATSQTITQLGAGEHNRGRVLALWSIIVNTGSPLGGLAAGLVADRWGVAPVLSVQALGVAAAAVLVFVLVLAWAGRRARQ
jgi:predicted MFS family arabinose efflux permease